MNGMEGRGDRPPRPSPPAVPATRTLTRQQRRHAAAARAIGGMHALYAEGDPGDPAWLVSTINTAAHIALDDDEVLGHIDIPEITSLIEARIAAVFQRPLEQGREIVDLFDQAPIGLILHVLTYAAHAAATDPDERSC